MTVLLKNNRNETPAGTFTHTGSTLFTAGATSGVPHVGFTSASTGVGGATTGCVAIPWQLPDGTFAYLRLFNTA